MADRFPPCPDSPNCVSSRHPKAARKIEPLRFTDDPEAAMDRLQQLIASRPGARIEARKRLSLHATFRSNVLRFVDDVYAEADPEASVIHWQSASRSGYWDFGVNKKRVEELRRLFNRTS